MSFKEWLKSLESTKSVTPAEDVADSIALFVIMALVCFVILL